MKRKIMYLVIVLIVGLGLIILSGFSMGQRDVIIGVIGPMTGPASQPAHNMRDAVALGIDEINKSGKLPGINLKMVVVDDEGNPTKSVNGIKRLVYMNKAIVVIGSVQSSCTLANMRITQETGIPQITSVSTSAQITKKGNKWIFRTSITDAVQAKNIVKIAVEKLGKKRIAIIHTLSDYGIDGAKEIVDNCTKLGYPPVAVESFNAEDKDFSSQLLKIKEKDPDTLIIWALYEPSALITIQAAQMGLEVQIMGGGCITDPKYAELSGEAANGTITCQTYHPSSKEPHIASFTEEFNKRYGRYPTPNAAQSYDAIMIVGEALEKVGVDDGSKIRDAIASTSNFNGVTGTISFDDTGEAPREMEIIQIRNGKYEYY